MSKIMKLKKNNRGQAFCSKCKKEILPGTEYLKATPYRRKAIIRCVECGIQPYELSSSPYVKRVHSLIDRWKLTKWATFEDVEYAMEEVEDMKNDVEYSLFNMPSNILLQDRAEALEECLDELEAIDTYEDEEDEDEDTNAGLGYNYRTDILSALQILI